MLSEGDIMNVMRGNVNIVAYPDLAKYSSVDDLFAKSNNIVLYFVEEITRGGEVGHFEAMKRDGQVIEFFDSYGLKYDQCRKFLSENTLIRLKESEPYLTQLFSQAVKSGYTVLWNHHKYQSMKANVNDCGKWSTCFLLNGDLRGNTFLKFITQIMQKYNLSDSDDAVNLWYSQTTK